MSPSRHGAVAGAAFTVCLKSSSAPEVLLFKRFQSQWQFIDQTKYSTSIGVAETSSDVLDTMKEEARKFAVDYLLINNSTRDDYREFLELSIIFLGGTPLRGVHLVVPGAMHHARWMSNVIYSLKVWMFREQFKLTTAEV